MSVNKVPVPVISVGNITLGGTGKTPVSMFILQKIIESERKPAYLSRGYGRKTKGFRYVDHQADLAFTVGDEALMVATHFPNHLVVVSENRVTGALKAIAEKNVDAIVLDDAFQHRKIFRDLDVVVVDVSDLGRQAWLLPAGNLREPYSALERGGFVLLSKSQSLAQCQLFAQKWKLKKWGAFRFSLEGFSGSNNKTLPPGSFRGMKVLLFSGIGNPTNFEETLQNEGMFLTTQFRFPDHYSYKKSDFERILNKFGDSHDIILTTEKDYCRLKGTGLMETLPTDKFYFTRVSMVWLKGKTEFENEIQKVLMNYGSKV